MIAVLALSLAATVCYVRAADVLLDFDYRGTRKQATLFAIVGLAGALAGCAIASQLVEGDRAGLMRAGGYACIGAGIAAGLSGISTSAMTFPAATGPMADLPRTAAIMVSTGSIISTAITAPGR